MVLTFIMLCPYSKLARSCLSTVALGNKFIISLFRLYLEPNPTKVKPGEPTPTKLLEILSECNWEPHRSLVLSTLFRRMNSDLLSEPFCFGMYKVQLLSTTVKGGEQSSTITYKVCISRAEEKEMTKDLQQPVKKAIRNHEAQSQKGDGASDTTGSILVTVM